MISTQLADKLYKEYGIISIVNDGKFVDFEDYIEKEKSPLAGTK